MLRESLPTGMDRPRAGQASMASASTARYSAASWPSSPAAAIQLAQSLMLAKSPTGAAQRLVSTSPKAIRTEAAGLTTAMGERSATAKAWPPTPSKSQRVTATSATGVCHGPTIWSRAVRPPTVRSPMVMRNCLDPTVGCRSTASMAPPRSKPKASKSSGGTGLDRASLCSFGGLPSSTDKGRSTG